MSFKKAQKYFSTQNQPLLLSSILLSVLLLILEFQFYRYSRSLLIFSVFLVQASLTAFILFAFLNKDTCSERKRLVTAFLNGFVLVLLTGYIFFEFIDRLSSPISISTDTAFVAAFLCLAINLLLVKLIFQTDLRRLKFGTFKLPIASVQVLLMIVLVGVTIIYFTNFHFLDTLLGLLFGLSIFIRAGFMMLDAYWHIYDLA